MGNATLEPPSASKKFFVFFFNLPFLARNPQNQPKFMGFTLALQGTIPQSFIQIWSVHHEYSVFAPPLPDGQTDMV